MSKRRKLWREAGQSLVELAVALPLIALLLGSLAMALGWGMRAYVSLLSDWELQNQVRFSMERITSDLMYAYRFESVGGRLRILIPGADGVPQWIEYVRTEEDRPRLARNSQPLTGESRLVDIAIADFEFRPVGTRTLFFRIKGENLRTGHVFELESAVTVANAEGL